MSSPKTQIKKTIIHINFVKLFFYIFIGFVIVLSTFSTLAILNAVIIAFVVSYLLNPIIIFFENKNIHRVFGIITIFIGLFSSLLLIGLTIKNYFPSYNTMTSIRDDIIVNVEKLQNLLLEKFSFINWEDIFESFNKSLNASSSLTSRLPGLISGIAGTSSLLLIIAFCTFFFLYDGKNIKRAFFKFIPNKYFEITVVTIREVDKIFGGYIRGTLLESLVIGILTIIGFIIIGFPIPTAIITGAIAGIGNAIPYIGPLIGGVLGVIVCFLNLIPDSFTPLFGIKATVLGVVIVVGVVQFFDNVAVKPSVIGQSVNLHPLLVILGIVVGSNMLGVVGMLIAIPIIAIIKVLVETLYKQLKGFQLLSDNLISVVSKDTLEDI